MIAYIRCYFLLRGVLYKQPDTLGPTQIINKCLNKINDESFFSDIFSEIRSSLRY